MLEFGWAAWFLQVWLLYLDHMCLKETCREWVGLLRLMFGSSCGGILPFTQLAGRYVLMLSGQNLLLAQIKPLVHYAAPAQEKERFWTTCSGFCRQTVCLPRCWRRMWKRTRQVHLPSTVSSLLTLSYLLQLLSEKAFCKQSAWQIPEQGQAVLCLWLSPCLGEHSCAAPLSTHSMRAGWVGDLWPAVQVGSIWKGGYLLWCPPRNESRPHTQYRGENSSRQAGRELWCIWITNRLRGTVSVGSAWEDSCAMAQAHRGRASLGCSPPDNKTILW